MRIAVDGTFFDVTDEGRGVALVLIHGFPLAKETWDAQALELASRARVIRFDLRGLGASSVTPGPYLMEALAGDAAGILDALDVGEVVLAGHSLGGYVALAFWRMFAERVRGLGLICTRAGADDDATARGRLELAQRAERDGMAPIVDAFLPRFFGPPIYSEQPQLIERMRVLVERTNPQGAAAMLRGMAARVSSEDLLAEIDVPLRVVGGRNDTLIPVERSQEIAAAVRGARLDVLECGHLPLYEAPQALTASLDGLLAEVAATRSCAKTAPWRTRAES